MDACDDVGRCRPGGQPAVPFAVKLVYTAFMAVLIPVYWMNYGPTNFLYFCDAALLLTLAGVWLENRLLISMSAVGILLPQFLWCVDFLVQLFGGSLTGTTSYMFESQRSLFLRSLSLFHGWLPFLLFYLVLRLGYDRRAVWAWTALAWALCLVCYFFVPPAGPEFAGKLTPNNVNYVWGVNDAKPQTWLPAPVYLLGWMLTLWLVIFMPTHFVLRRWFVKNFHRS